MDLYTADLRSDFALALSGSGFMAGMNLVSLRVGELRAGSHRCSIDLT